jgi:thioredoxin:protein disulfide reductase
MEPTNNSLTILGIFLLGLGLNLTPCVYPMLSITLSLFGVKTEAKQSRAFIKALIYVLGMATMYSTLGVISAFTGGFFGALLQNKFVLIGIALLLFALSLSMFGAYTFQLPSNLVNKIAGKRGTSLVGIYISGLFVGIFAAPCIGPPILALLAFVGTKGDPLFAFWIFFVMSLGLGTPYLILGTFSGLLKKLPKSGVWLIWMERVFGVVLLSLAGFYLLLAFQPSLLKWIIPASLIAGGIYLGFFERSANYSAGFIRIKKTIGILAVLVGIAIPVLAPKQSVVWQPFSPSQLAQAKESQKPAILDFYADWCIPCHELDQITYTDPRVIQALDGFVRLKVDMTRPDDPNSTAATERFEIVGVPTIIFLDANGEEIVESRVTGYIDADELLRILKSPRLNHS